MCLHLAGSQEEQQQQLHRPSAQSPTETSSLASQLISKEGVPHDIFDGKCKSPASRSAFELGKLRKEARCSSRERG